MIHFTQAEIDQWIVEDLPLHDETTRVLGLPAAAGTLRYVVRQPGVLAGMVPVLRLAQALGLQAEALAADGEPLLAGQPVLRLEGPAPALHRAWKQGMNLFEYLSGIASTTAAMVNAARAENPAVQVAATRKAFPGARRLQQYAVLCGGGMVHRAGLSETVLVFAQHRVFVPALTLGELVQRARRAGPEKFILVEADSSDDALQAVAAGADGVQLDKMQPPALAALVPRLRALRPHLTINAAGGIRPDNAAHYAATGVDVLVTSSLYTAAALDFAALMAPVDETPATGP